MAPGHISLPTNYIKWFDRSYKSHLEKMNHLHTDPTVLQHKINVLEVKHTNNPFNHIHQRIKNCV